MSTELWLAEPRVVLDAPGAAWHYDFGAEQYGGLGERVRRGELHLTHALWEPVGGVVMGLPDLSLTDTMHDLWVAEGSAWQAPGLEPQALLGVDRPVWRRGMAYGAETGAWSLTSRDEAPQGQARVMQILTYAGGLGGSRLTIDLGGVWQMVLSNDGSALLSRRDGENWRRRAVFRWLGRPCVANEQHTLWVYEVGPKLVIRSLDVPMADASTGVAVWDDAPQEDDAGRASHHALHRGTWRLSGFGRAVLGCGPSGWLVDEVSVETDLPEPAGSFLGVTQPVLSSVWGWAPDRRTKPALAVWDQDDNAYPIWPGMPATTPASALRWRLTWQNTEGSPYFLSALSLATPPTVRADGNTGTDLLALPGVADRAITLTREGDALHERLRARVVATDDLAAYCQPNMSLRYVVDGVTRFRGLTDAAEWGVEAHAQPVLGQLSLRAAGLDKVFGKSAWPGGRPFDGRRLTDCLVELAEAAGLTPDRYAIVDDPYRLPEPPTGHPPTLAYRAGSVLASILADLRRCYFGDWLTCYWALADGRWVVTYAGRGSGQPAATFFATEAAARAAGTAGRVILSGSYQEVLDESRLANVVTVVGQAPDGRALRARCIDWGSIRDRTAPNYVGAVWPLTVADPALTTQSAVNYVCRSRFEQVRFARVYAQFKSVRVDLQPGDLVQLIGRGFGDLYRLRGVQLEQAAEGEAADPSGRAAYSLEKLR